MERRTAANGSVKREHVLYGTEWKGYRVQILYGNPPERDQIAVRGSEKPEDYWIRLQNGEGQTQIVIPPMSAISDLVDTIERKAGLEARETNDPETLDTFNELLEEEL